MAILGSVLSAIYRSRIDTHLTGLPSGARDTAKESISGAYAVASQLGAPGRSLIGASNDAFVSAMHWSAVGSAIVAVLGIVAVLLWLPSRSVVHTAPAPVETLAEQLELADA